MRLFEGISKIEKSPSLQEALFSTHFDATILLCDIPIRSYEMMNITKYDVIQNNFTEICAVKGYNLCVFLWVNQEENVP